MCSAVLKESAASFQGIRGYISVMAALKVSYFLMKGKMFLLKIIAKRLELAICLFRMTIRIINKFPVLKKWRQSV
jgi:hypothetical protein